MDYIKLGKRIKTARKKKGYTQAKLAELTGYSTQHISHIETGETKLSVDLLVLLANELEVSLDELFADSLTNKPDNTKVGYLLDGCSQGEVEILINTMSCFKRNLDEYLRKLFD